MRKRVELDEIYPNAPLTEVACEVRFPGEVAVESNRHEFWDRIRGEYPVIKVPPAQPGTAPATQHYRFQNPGETRTVAVAINSLAFSDQKYTTHQAFLAEFERLHGLFRASYRKIKSANRIGWRYVNAIPFVRERGVVPLQQFFRISFELARSLPGMYRALNLTFEVPTKEGVATVRLVTAQDKRGEGKEAFLLDLDFATEGDLAFADAPEILRRAHRANRQVFEDLITDEYRAHLRGESL